MQTSIVIDVSEIELFNTDLWSWSTIQPSRTKKIKFPWKWFFSFFFFFFKKKHRYSKPGQIWFVALKKAHPYKTTSVLEPNLNKEMGLTGVRVGEDPLRPFIVLPLLNKNRTRFWQWTELFVALINCNAIPLCFARRQRLWKSTVRWWSRKLPENPPSPDAFPSTHSNSSFPERSPSFYSNQLLLPCYLIMLIESPLMVLLLGWSLQNGCYLDLQPQLWRRHCLCTISLSYFTLNNISPFQFIFEIFSLLVLIRAKFFRGREIQFRASWPLRMAPLQS